MQLNLINFVRLLQKKRSDDKDVNSKVAKRDKSRFSLKVHDTSGIFIKWKESRLGENNSSKISTKGVGGTQRNTTGGSDSALFIARRTFCCVCVCVWGQRPDFELTKQNQIEWKIVNRIKFTGVYGPWSGLMWLNLFNFVNHSRLGRHLVIWIAFWKNSWMRECHFPLWNRKAIVSLIFCSEFKSAASLLRVHTAMKPGFNLHPPFLQMSF